MKKMIYRVILNDKVVAVFASLEFAKDFVEYQETIRDDVFEIESLPIADWLLQPRDF